MSQFSLSKEERLHGRTSINRLFAVRDGGFCYPFRWVILRESDSDAGGVSVLFSVPKKMIRRANKRNLIKRRMREGYRLNKCDVVKFATDSGCKISLGLIYVAKEPLVYGTIEAGVKKILAEVCKGG